MRLEVLGTVLLGGVAALDATPLAQSLLSQPLVTASLLGWLWNDWDVALRVGVVLQILAASTLPIGARTPEDYAAGGVVGTGLALLLADDQLYAFGRDASAVLGVFAGMAAAWGGVPLMKWQRRSNEALSRWCEVEIRRGAEAALRQAHLAAVVLAFAIGVAYCAICLGLGSLGLDPLVEHASLKLSRAWWLAQPLWLGLGLAQLLHAFTQRRLARAALFGAALITAWVVISIGAP